MISKLRAAIIYWLCVVLASCGSQSGTVSTSASSSASHSSADDGSRGNPVLAINSGGREVTYDGILFEADRLWSGGAVNTTDDPVENAQEDGLFQSERYGTFSYEIPVTNDSYDIQLFFNELYQTAEGARVFDIAIEGRPFISQLDLYSLAGHDVAHSEMASSISIEDGAISITFNASVDNATLSGLAIYSESGEIVEPSYEMVEARNPIIWADVPDVSVIRVGETYYMSSTTMHMNPGVPIMKSKDLVNWSIVNYAHRALDSDHPRLNLDPQQEAYGEGSWASSIRYFEDTYYVTTFSNTTRKTYIYKTQDIENGPWQTSVLNAHLHDSSLFFDDGHAYMIYGVDDIRIVELNSDLTAVRSDGVNQILIPQASRIAGSDFYVPAEGAQIQKINDWYYVNLISWPRGGSRSQLVYRSKNLLGPYEGRVVLERSVAQGKLIDTPSGDWWAMLFKDSGAVGRIPYLVPVQWADNWPVLGVNGDVPEFLNFHVEDRGIGGIVRSDEFNNPALDLVWQWNHNPVANGWSLTERPDYLRLKNQRIDSSFVETRNTLTQRMFGPRSSAIVAVEVSNMKDGDISGIGALQDKYGYIAVAQQGNQRSVIVVKNVNGRENVEELIDVSSERVYLRIDGDFRNQIDEAKFFYSLDGERWLQVGNVLKMEYVLTHFMGYRFALFNYGTKNTGGYVDFDYFHLNHD